MPVPVLTLSHPCIILQGMTQAAEGKGFRGGDHLAPGHPHWSWSSICTSWEREVGDVWSWDTPFPGDPLSLSGCTSEPTSTTAPFSSPPPSPFSMLVLLAWAGWSGCDHKGGCGGTGWASSLQGKNKQAPRSPQGLRERSDIRECGQ
jgi:hypothetical protein